MSPPHAAHHIIRLRGFWQPVALAQGHAWERHFGRPLHLDPQETVWLTVAGLPPQAAVVLNEHPLGTANADGSWEGPITPHLQRRNSLRIVLPDSQQPADSSSESSPHTMPSNQTHFRVEIYFCSAPTSI
jgi:hypothetical protein